MKKYASKVLLALLVVFVFSATLKAEYGGITLKYEVSLCNGTDVTAYARYPSYFINGDSLGSKHFIIKRLMNTGHDSVQLFGDLIYYDFELWQNLQTQHSLLNPFYIKLADIESIQVLSQIKFSYMLSIGTNHKLADTLWMKKPVVDTLSGVGYLCLWNIYVHERNEDVDRILTEFVKAQETVKRLRREVNAAYNTGDPMEYDTPNQALKDYLDTNDLDKELGKILSKLDDYKVVIIQECSC